MEKSKKNDKNVDEKDLQHLGSFSSSWWDLEGPLSVLIYMNPLRISFILDGLVNTGIVNAENKDKPDALRGLKILDVGCGAGILTEALAKLKANVTGLEPSTDLIEAARDHLNGQSLNIEYSSELIEEHSVDNAEKYDVVVASEVVEHVPNQKLFLAEMAKCLKPNGSIFITTPNRTLVSLLLVKVFAEYLTNILPKGTHDWNQFIQQPEVEEILKENNCSKLSTRGIFYIPYFRKFNFIKYEGIQYALHAVKDGNKKHK